MNKPMIAAFCALAAVVAFAKPLTEEMKKAADEARAKYEAMSPDEQAAYRNEVQMRRFGGWVIKAGSGSGKVAYVNCQKKASSDVFLRPMSEIEDLVQCKLELQQCEEPVTVGSADKALLKTGAEAAIFIIDDPVLPSVLVAPENDWAFLNVGVLLKDAPEEKVASKRLAKETWRVFAMLLGAAESQMGGCVLVPVSDLKDLDSIPGEAFCPEPVNSIREHLRHIGVKPYVKSTYQTACKQGWAPAPTNSYQQAIWDKVHQLPSEPIKIAPEPKPAK